MNDDRIQYLLKFLENIISYGDNDVIKRITDELCKELSV